MDILSYVLARNFAKKNIKNVDNEIADITNILGAKNLLKNTGVDTSFNGIQYTVNNDGSVRIYGNLTSEMGSGFVLNDNAYLQKGSYKLTTGQSNESETLIMIYAVDLADGGQTILGQSNENNGEFTITEDKNVAFGISADEPEVDITIYPMCRLSSIQDNTYVPYVMTNKELTENINFTTPTFDKNFEGRMDVKRWGKLVSVYISYYAASTGRISLATNLPPCATPFAYGTCIKSTSYITTQNIVSISWDEITLDVKEGNTGQMEISLLYMTML